VLGSTSVVPSLNTKAQLAELQRDLGAWSNDLARVEPSFRRAYLPVLKQFDKPFDSQAFHGTTAAFVVDRDRHQLVFNSAALEVFQRQINDMERDSLIPVEMAAVARHIAIEQFVLHELPHLTIQGIGNYEDIAPLKKLAGREALAEFDLRADFLATRVGARLEMLRAGERGWQCYASRLLQQQYVMGEFAFKAFKAPAEKPHKRQRFLGIAMATALTRNALWNARPPRKSAGGLPIGTPIMPYFDTDGLMILFKFDPEKSMWGRPRTVDSNLLISTCAGLDERPFASSVDKAARLLEQYGTIPCKPNWPT
jgi:hypothetical protein